MRKGVLLIKDQSSGIRGKGLTPHVEWQQLPRVSTGQRGQSHGASGKGNLARPLLCLCHQPACLVLC
jgi:hypothetical protein